MQRILIAVLGLALGLAVFGDVAVVAAQEAPDETTVSPNADGAVNRDGPDVAYGDIGPNTQVGEPTTIVQTPGSTAPPRRRSRGRPCPRCRT
jgi:hypothetical protein